MPARQARPSRPESNLSRPVRLSFDGPLQPERGVKASHAIAVLVVAALAIFGGMQVIGTEADDNAQLEQFMAAQGEGTTTLESLTGPTGVTSSGQSSEAAPLAGLTEPVIPIPPAPEEADASKRSVGFEPAETSSTESETSTEEDEDAPAVDDDSACPPVTPGAPYCLYVVQDGDTLSQIAAALGISSTAAFSGAELVALSNGLNDAQNWLIVPGQELRIPIESGVIHTVTASDTVSLLAESYGITTNEVIAANAFPDPNNIPVGEPIIIPSPNLWPWTGPVTAAAEEAPEETALLESSETEEPTEAAEAATAEPTDTPPPADTETPEPEPTEAIAAQAAVPQSTSANANPSVGNVRDDFAAGYIAGGGPAQYLEHILAAVIPCESGYNVRAYNPAGPFYGLMQFLGETWARTGGGDWADAWQQGHNTAVLLQGSSPATQWPHCWHGG